jgi:DNA-binding FadR family transcriptional regulator
MLQFGVSRPTLREAFRLLEAEHLIEIRRGARGGARVQLPDISVAAQYAGLLLQIRGTTLADVYEARLLIEPPLAGLCAQRCAPEHLDELQRILDLEAAAVGQDPHALARHFTQFHQLIVDGAGNTTLAMLAGMLANVAERHLAVEILSKLGRPEQEVDNRRAYRAHRKLLGLIRQRDSEGSEVFWRKHMEVARDYMLGEIGATTVVDLVP